jgi:hypothetical protein
MDWRAESVSSLVGRCSDLPPSYYFLPSFLIRFEISLVMAWASSCRGVDVRWLATYEAR